MNKTLFGLALLSYNWKKDKKDIFDSYAQLVCHAIRKKDLQSITRDNVQSELLETYGINISLGACESLLKRMSKSDVLKKEALNYKVNNEKVSETVKNSKKEELNAAFRALVIDIKKYSQETFEIALETQEIEDGLINFFKENDVDLLFANDNGISILPKTRDIKKAKYIIAKYITFIYDNEPNKFTLVLKLAEGYAIASLITYEDIQSYSGSLNEVEIFLDAPIIFNLIGLNGESSLALGQELINTLNTNQAKLRLFEINYEEVVKTIQDAIRRLNDRDYELVKSSRILKTAVRENITSQDLQIKLNQLDDVLKKCKISRIESPSLEPNDWRYQINEQKLSKTIEDLYKINEKHRLAWYKLNQIERDVKSISNIFKIRKRTQAVSLKTSKAIFLTNNDIIAFSTKKYEQTDWEFISKIPACLTDVLMSTILWANYPSKNDNLNIKLLMSECYNIIELDNALLKKYYDDINKMHVENAITPEQFYLLNSSNLAYSLLEKKTLNDIEEYTDKTPAEILEDIQLKIYIDLNAEKEKNSRIDRNIRKFSTICGRVGFFMISGFIICLSLLFKIITPKLDTNIVNVIVWSVAGLIAIFGILRWMDLIPTRTKVEKTIDDFIYNKLSNILNN